ncbi:hypothetical protein GW17_00038743 [Ensete ventricosum]|nr:hypothetical protein GW17_00038743 [Ensete ventricosum]RZS14558.1 hypothetical protein BHM03_00046263 [Ensete ventricosum]
MLYGTYKQAIFLALPLGEYAAVALLTFFGLKSIKNAWEIPSDANTNSKEKSELGELVEAEELVKEKVKIAFEVAKKLTNPFEVLWKSFSLVFFAVSVFLTFIFIFLCEDIKIECI